MTKRSIDASVAAAHIKRHCAAAIERAAKRPAPEEAHLEIRKRLRTREAPQDEGRPSPDWVSGREEGWLAGVEEGRRKAAESFASDVVPEMERLVRAALGELNSRYDDMFLELCRDFGDRSGRPPRFVY